MNRALHSCWKCDFSRAEPLQNGGTEVPFPNIWAGEFELCKALMNMLFDWMPAFVGTTNKKNKPYFAGTLFTQLLGLCARVKQEIKGYRQRV